MSRIWTNFSFPRTVLYCTHVELYRYAPEVRQRLALFVGVISEHLLYGTAQMGDLSKTGIDWMTPEIIEAVWWPKLVTSGHFAAKIV